MLCDRPHCDEDATARIPLPVGLSDKAIYVCSVHEEAAREACYYVLRLDQDEDSGEADFRNRIWEKHRILRGSDQLKFLPGRRWWERGTDD